MKYTSDKMTVQVIVNGRPVKTYEHDGRTYIEGKHSTQYSIRVRNNTHGKICAVVSVDGLDVIKGERASTQSQGYLIGSKSYIDIDGFRTSNEHVGAFKFASKKNSYAASKGSEAVQNVGIIGVVAYSERAKPVQYSCNFISTAPYYSTSCPPQPYRYDTVCSSFDSKGGNDDIAMASAGTCDWMSQERSTSSRRMTTSSVTKGTKTLAAFDMGTTLGGLSWTAP